MSNRDSWRIRVAIVHLQRTEGAELAAQLQREADMDVRGVYASSRDLEEGLRGGGVDVALLACVQDGRGVLDTDLIRVLRAKHPYTRLIALCNGACPADRVQAFLSGVRGFVGTACGPGPMLEAIRTVFTSAVYPDIRAPEFGGRAIVRSECESESANAGGMIYASIPLSRRERDVIRCYLQGMTVTEIAAKFNRSVKTISTQKVTAFRKLGVSSYAELFRLQEARGLI